MQLKINQKLFAIGNKFQVSDSNGNAKFLASEQLLQLARQSDLYDLEGNQIYHIHKNYLSLFGKFDITQNGQHVGEFLGKPSLIFKRYQLTSDKGNFFVVAGPIGVKAYIAGTNWEYNKEEPILTIKKQFFKIGDTYMIDFDENVMDPSIAALIGIWYDILVHSGSKDHGLIDTLS